MVKSSHGVRPAREGPSQPPAGQPWGGGLGMNPAPTRGGRPAAEAGQSRVAPHHQGGSKHKLFKLVLKCPW